MDNTEQDIIPIDGRVEDFRKHLEANPRTILSARFGDGKSFFLNKVIEESKEDTTYIVVHPVHYQVSDNKDIFELVKRDILLQMIGLGMISANYEIPEHIIFSYYLQHNTTDIAKDLLSSLFKVLPNIATTTPIANSLGGFGGLGFSAIIEGIKSLRNNYISFRGNLGLDTDKLIETFLKETECFKNNSIKSDAITALIRENIERWQNEEQDKEQDKKRKRVVLVFEDMDRIDPAHLFRIMNVLSSQIDANCITDEAPSGVTKNRFGVDNVVLVLDYDNLKSIFHHFYGENTDFSGYIHKFAPKEVFHFSLGSEREKYLMNLISRITGFKEESFYSSPGTKPSVSMLLFEKDLRKILNCLDRLELGIRPNAQHGNIILSEGILKFIIFLRRMGCSEMYIQDYLLHLSDKSINIDRGKLRPAYTEPLVDFFELWALGLRHINNNTSGSVILGYAIDNKTCLQVDYDLDAMGKDKVKITAYIPHNNEMVSGKIRRFEEIFEALFKYIHNNSD